MAAYRWVDNLRSPAGWLPVHRDQLRAQRSVSSMGSLYLYLFNITREMHGLQLKIIIRMLWTRVWLLHGDSIPQTSCKAMSGQNNHILGWNAYVAPARNESLCMYVCIHLFKSGISFGLHVQSIVLTVKSGSAMWQGDILMFCVFLAYRHATF